MSQEEVYVKIELKTAISKGQRHCIQVIRKNSRIRSRCRRTQVNLAKEIRLVAEALERMEPTRKCYRMIGGVLIERTAEEVRPAILKNREDVLSS